MRRATVFYIVFLMMTAIFDYFSVLHYRCGKQKQDVTIFWPYFDADTYRIGLSFRYVKFYIFFV